MSREKEDGVVHVEDEDDVDVGDDVKGVDVDVKGVQQDEEDVGVSYLQIHDLHCISRSDTLWLDPMKMAHPQGLD